jgi:hypothetical protein
LMIADAAIFRQQIAACRNAKVRGMLGLTSGVI